MRSVVFLSGEDVELAIGELEGVISSFGVRCDIEKIDGRLALIHGAVPEGTAQRMGLCHFSGDLYRSSDPSMDDIREMICSYLKEMRKERSISVKIISPASIEPISPSTLFEEFCSIAREEGFKVHHRSPEHQTFLIIGKFAYIGEIKETTSRDLTRSRRGSKMPFNRPIIMEPQLARCMVNLSSLPPGSTILDPFMGPAGLSLEAGHLGHKVIGVERDPNILEGARKNIEAQGLSKMIVSHLGDSRLLNEYEWWNEISSIDGIVTDPPFGRSAPLMGEDPSRLLKEVIRVSSRKMRIGSPLVLDTDREEYLSDIDGFELIRTFPFRVHKSLTRYIGILEKVE